MLSKDEIRQILQNRFINDKHTSLNALPLPNKFKDIYKGANRIKRAIENNEQIAIVGDYDVDGIISCVIMAEFFDEIGVNYIIKIPNRFKDGYGLNSNIVKELNTKLIITVDNGISAIEAAELCLERGIDLIITDHHIPPQILPRALAIINPKQQDNEPLNIEICGAQVAWYLLAAVKEVCKIKIDMSQFIELLAIAIMADMMELRDLNRVLVRKGIEKINSSKRPAFKAIKQFFQKSKFETENISFLIAPLINSTGRMDDAKLSFEFLYSKNEEKALLLLEQITTFNNQRKSEEKRIFEESLSKVSDEDFAVVVSGANWHEGVLGIVASRLAKHFNKPAFVFSEFEDRAKGSARTVGKIDILELCESQKDLFLNYGGHKGAGGMLVELKNLSKLKAGLNTFCQNIPKEDFISSDEILGLMSIDDVDFEMLELLEYFEPYGHKNPRPLFEFKNLSVKNVKKLGKDEKHLKLILGGGRASVEALFFNFGKELSVGETISLVASIGKNEFGGVIKPQLLIKHLKG